MVTGPSLEHCLCMLQTAYVALTLLIGLVAPTVIGWGMGFFSKAQWLQASGCKLQVRVPAAQCLRSYLHARGIQVLWPGWGLAAPCLLVAMVLLVWQVAELTVLAYTPGCRVCGLQRS